MSGGGERKYDRNRKSAQNLRYKAENKHGKSHIKRIKRHLERQPNDAAAKVALKAYGG